MNEILGKEWRLEEIGSVNKMGTARNGALFEGLKSGLGDCEGNGGRNEECEPPHILVQISFHLFPAFHIQPNTT